jgi:hypothetical protein
MSALSVLNHYTWKHLRPGENEKDFAFTGPGVVVICREPPKKDPSEVSFSILTAVSAENDALTVASRMLGHRAK